MSFNYACHAAAVVLAILLGITPAAGATPLPGQGADQARPADPGAWLAALAGKTFGRIGDEGEPSLLIRFEAVPGQEYRVVETERSGVATTTIAANQRGQRWKGKFASMPLDFRTGESAVVDPEGVLALAWSSWGTTSERTYRLLPDGVLERRARGGGADGKWRSTRLALIDAGREQLLRDQIAIEADIFRQDVAARVKVLMAESEERRRRNREQFWNGLAQATLVLAHAAAEVAADMDADQAASGSQVASGLARALDPAAAMAPATTSAAPAPGAAPAAAAPLRFVMMIGLMNKPGDTVNPTCYSNIVTRPGPAGWGAGGFLPSGSAEQARQSVESLRDQFFARCRASGREITSAGNFEYRWNQSPGDEQRLAEAQPRYAEDVLVRVD